MGLCEEPLPTQAYGRKEKEGIVQGNGEKMFIEGKSYKGVSAKICETGEGLHLCLPHSPSTREQLQWQHGNNRPDRTQNEQDDRIPPPVKIEKLVKQYKTHRCALDFDKSFINSSIVVANTNNESATIMEARE